jgi:hypothetical protein
LIGNDGGIAKLTTPGVGASTCPTTPEINSTAAFTTLNNGYGVTQFYSGAVLPSDTGYVGGTLGLGTVSGSDGGPNSWVQILGRNGAALDGGSVAVDPSNPNVISAEHTGNSIKKSTDGGVSFAAANTGISDTGFLYIAPFVMDPTEPQRLWTGGTYLSARAPAFPLRA